MLRLRRLLSYERIYIFMEPRDICISRLVGWIYVACYCLNQGSFEFLKLRTKSVVARRQESKRLGVAVESKLSRIPPQ